MVPQNNITDDIKSYVKVKEDIIKLRFAKGMSISLSAILAWLLIISMLQLVLIALTVTIVLATGVLLKNYMTGALIALGIYTLTLVILIVFRKKLFTGAMIQTFVNLLFPEENEVQ